MKKVICNATNEEVSMAYCKDCALHPPSPCGYDYALIKRIHASLQPRGGIHVTDLVHCLRRTYYERTQNMPERPADAMYRVIGTATHGLLEHEEDQELITEMPLEYEGVVGTVDAYYPTSDTLVDFKTSRWLIPAKLPYGDHELQVNVYRWLLEANSYPVNRMFLQYIDLSGPSKCRSCKLPLIEESGVFVCPKCGKANGNGHHGTALVDVPMMLLDEVEAFVLERKQLLEEALEHGELAPADPGFLCNYCQFRNICPDSQAG